MILQERILKRFSSKPFAQLLMVEFCLFVSSCSATKQVMGRWDPARLATPPQPLATGHCQVWMSAEAPWLRPWVTFPWCPPGSPPPQRVMLLDNCRSLILSPVAWGNCGASGRQKHLWRSRFAVHFLLHVGNPSGPVSLAASASSLPTPTPTLQLLSFLLPSSSTSWRFPK